MTRKRDRIKEWGMRRGSLETGRNKTVPTIVSSINHLSYNYPSVGGPVFVISSSS